MNVAVSPRINYLLPLTQSGVGVWRCGGSLQATVNSKVQSILSKNKDFEVDTFIDSMDAHVYTACSASAFIVPLCSCYCVLYLSLALTARI